MSAFETVFTLLGMVLGLAVAEVLAGFARALKLKKHEKPVRIGWLTPLLGLLVIIDLATFWMIAWDLRDGWRVDFPIMVSALAIVAVYYLAATMVFPDDPDDWPNYDDWYDRHHRTVIGAMLFCTIASAIGGLILPVAAEAGAEEAAGAAASDTAILVSDVTLGLFLLALAALMTVRGRQLSIALLVGAIVMLSIGSMSDSLF